VARARNISDGMLAPSAKAIVSLVDAHLPGAYLLRQVENLRTISAAVAEVTKKAEDEGLGRIN
jgi:malate dehydrogenase (oxaloacetate-decarboxylating)